MTSSTNVVINTNLINDDLFLCRAFAKAISSDKLLHVIEQQSIPITISTNVSSNEDIRTPIPTENDSKWNIGDLCFCPFSEDGLLYKATIIDISSSSCTILFDDYGNEEIHSLNDLQIRTEQEEQLPSIDEPIIENDSIATPPSPSTAPPLFPPFPQVSSSDENATLSATLMSWYLAGYHTGFYQAIKETKN